MRSISLLPHRCGGRYQKRAPGIKWVRRLRGQPGDHAGGVRAPVRPARPRGGGAGGAGGELCGDGEYAASLAVPPRRPGGARRTRAARRPGRSGGSGRSCRAGRWRQSGLSLPSGPVAPVAPVPAPLRRPAGAQQGDDGVHDPPERVRGERADLRHDEVAAGGEELARPRIALHLEGAARECRRASMMATGSP